MANLTAPYDIQRAKAEVASYKVAANAVIYAGAFVEIDSNGYATKHIQGAAKKVVGVALESVDNTGGANGDKTIEVLRQGVITRDLAAGHGFTQASIGADVYAEDDNTVTGTATGRTKVGRLIEFASSTIRMEIVPTA